MCLEQNVDFSLFAVLCYNNLIMLNSVFVLLHIIRLMNIVVHISMKLLKFCDNCVVSA